jgi:hypothetical protein
LETYTTVDASGKVNPVPISSLGIFAWAIMNTSYWTGIYAVSNAFTDFCNNCVRHVLDSLFSVSAISSLAGEWGVGDKGQVSREQGGQGKTKYNSCFLPYDK